MFVTGLGRASSKEDRVTMLIGDIDISRFIVMCGRLKKIN